MSLRNVKDNSNDDKIIQKNQTLDALHRQKIRSMHDSIEQLPTKMEKCTRLKKEIEKLKSIGLSELTEIQVMTLYNYEDELNELEEEIKKTDEENMLIDYFVETSDVLYKYYENMESISTGNDSGRKKKLMTMSTNKQPHTIIDFFNKKRSSEEKKTPVEETTIDATSDKDSDDDSSSDDEKIEHYVSRQKLLDNYLTITDPQHLSDMIDEVDQEICPKCGTERVLYQNEALLMCPNPTCGETEIILMDSNKPSYKDPPREMSFYSYKRINHFNEWLAQFQAKETTDINEEVYNSILLELKKERVTDMARLTPQKMKDILKRLGYNKYYEHIPHIINRLNGLPAPVMTRETEEKLRSMFKEIQAPFIKHCPEMRKNFLSYSYVLHKLCQLLELDEFLHCFPMLKSREKLHQQDQIWEKICEELGWEFIKSI